MLDTVCNQIEIPLRMHRDGSSCTCEPHCNCHPPTRDETFSAACERGSFHLKTCPAFPRVPTAVMPR